MKEVILVGVCSNDSLDFNEKIEEMKSLAEACDMQVVFTLTQNLEKANRHSYLGSGKIEELKNIMEDYQCDTLLIVEELSVSQQKNMEKQLECTIIDKTALILHIFALRAQSREARIQVECARLKYVRPRLSGSYTHMDRQRGKGRNRGSGEMKLELDVRNISNRIHELEKELKVISEQRYTQRKKRKKNDMKTVALCGYTNAGKSSIMNAFVNKYSKEEKKVLEKDMLFATLTTSTRQIELNKYTRFLLSDTVGFICDLPHSLIQAFHSTLEEIREADLILMVIDTSNKHYHKHIEVTLETLKEIKADHIPILYVFNKCDLSKQEYPAKYHERIYISAKQEESLTLLSKTIKETLFSKTLREIMLPYHEGALLSLINKQCEILTQEYKEDKIYIKAYVDNEIDNKTKLYQDSRNI